MTRLPLIALALLLSGCPPRPTVAPTRDPALSEPWVPLESWYQTAEPPALCPPPEAIDQLLLGAMDLNAGWAKCLARLDALGEGAGVDARVAAGQISHERARAERYAAQRWWLLGGGAAAGVVGTVLLMVLAR